VSLLAPVSAKADWLLRTLTVQRRALIGAGLARIGLGAVSVFLYLREYGDRHFLWGPGGMFPWRDFLSEIHSRGTFSLYAISRSGWWFEIVFHLGLVTAVLFMIGWRTRIITIAHFILLISLYERNSILLDGGDNALWIILIFWFWVDSGSRLSLDARRRAKKGRQPDTESLRYQVGSLLHHAALLAVIGQICTIYLVSGMYKVQGERWQNGTALYYILRVDQFTWPGVNNLIYEHSSLVTMLTYGTVFFQLSFTFLLFNRAARPYVLFGGIMLHLGIWIHMGLLGFSLTMISLELVIMGDKHYLRFAAAARHARRRLAEGRTSPRPSRPQTGKALPETQAGSVTSDG
jgi:antimicrobial peptide system SdpB family protein